MPAFFPFPIKLSCYSVGASSENRFKYTRSIVMPHQKTNKITGSSIGIPIKTDNFSGSHIGNIFLFGRFRKIVGKTILRLTDQFSLHASFNRPGQKKSPETPGALLLKIWYLLFPFFHVFPVPVHKFIHTTGGVNQFHFPGIKRV